MTKQILLARHVQALDAKGQEIDIDRQLSKRGKEDAQLLGSWLKEQKVSPDKIYVSTAQRTLATAKIYTEILAYPQENLIFESDIYGATLNTLHKLITSLNENTNFVMIIGHNPTISQVADFMATTQVESFSTGAMCLLSFNNLNYWEELVNDSGDVVWYQNPFNLRK